MVDDSKMVYQIRTSWNTLIPYMEEIAASVQRQLEFTDTGEKQGMVAVCAVGK